MKNERIDPLFNNPLAVQKAVLASVQPVSSLVAANEKPPLSPTTRQPMTLVEGGYNGKTFHFWADLDQRLAIPARV